MGVVSELRRRNVLRMVVLYVVAAWLIMQVGEGLMYMAILPCAKIRNVCRSGTVYSIAALMLFGCQSGTPDIQTNVQPNTQQTIVYDAWNLLQGELDATGNGAFLSLDRSKIYVLDSELNLRDFSNVTINGNGATIRRADASEIRTLLAEDNYGSRIIHVTSVPDNYRIGDKLAIASGESISAVTLNPRKIVAISGNTISLERELDGDWHAGDTVFKTFRLIGGLPSSVQGGSNPGIIIENVTFDGNGRNNTINFGWVINGTITLHGGKTSQIRNNRFEDIPNETIVGHGVGVHHNVFDGLNGSAFHTSVHDNTVDLNGLAFFGYNTVLNMNRIPESLNGHSEGAITFSWGGGNLLVYRNYFFSETGHDGILGSFAGSPTNTDENLAVVYNVAENFEYIIQIYSPQTSPTRNILISFNVFSNAGDNDFTHLANDASSRLGCNTLTNGTTMTIDASNNHCIKRLP